jgi:hypothetical protein
MDRPARRYRSPAARLVLERGRSSAADQVDCAPELAAARSTASASAALGDCVRRRRCGGRPSGSSTASRPSDVTRAHGPAETLHEFALATASASAGGEPAHAPAARLATAWPRAVDRPRMEPISSNGMANKSCRTNARRSRGVARRARPAARAPPSPPSTRFALGIGALTAQAPRLGAVVPSILALRDGSLRPPQHVQTSRHTLETTVVNHPPRFSMVAGRRRWRRKPGFLHRIPPASPQRAEQAVGHSPEPKPVLLELFGQPSLGACPPTPFFQVRHTPDE